jgi:hypothetical protein
MLLTLYDESNLKAFAEIVYTMELVGLMTLII